MSGKPRHKHPTHAVLSVNSFHSRVCFNMHAGLLPFSNHPCSFCLSLSVTFSCSVSLHLVLMLMLCLFCVLNQLGCLYQGGPMTLSTADPASKACWESSGCKGGIGARYDWLLEFVSVSVCLSFCVYSVLMCTLVFLRLQTDRQPVLANGIYGKTFKWYNQLIKNYTMTQGQRGYAFLLPFNIKK